MYVVDESSRETNYRILMHFIAFSAFYAFYNIHVPYR